MRAVIMDAPGQIKVAEQVKPTTQPHEVLVQVRATGICAGDIYIYQGKNPYVLFPAIGGHEISGSVAQVDDGVTGIAVGSRASANCFPEALQLLASGAITYPRVATEFSMWDAPDVFDELNSNPAMVHKAVLTI